MCDIMLIPTTKYAYIDHYYLSVCSIHYFLLFTVSASVAMSVPAVVVALQVYGPPWDVRTGVNCIVLVRVPVDTSLLTTAMFMSILVSTGASHCTIKSSVSKPPSSRVTEQVREKDSPAVGAPVEEIVTPGRGAEEWIK